MKYIGGITVCTVAGWMGSAAIAIAQEKDASAEKQAVVFFERMSKDQFTVEDFTPNDPLAELCVKRIKLGHSFNTKLETKFGVGAVHDFNFAMQGGEIYIRTWPVQIVKAEMEVKPLKDGVFLFYHDGLGTWPVSKPRGWKVPLSETLAANQQDSGEYKKTLEREIFYYEKGVSLLDSDTSLTMKKLRQEMEKAFKDFK